MKKAAARLIVVKKAAETAAQFLDRVEKLRGTRVTLDNALAASLDLLEAPAGALTPYARALVETDRAIVRQARDDDPLGIKPPSTEVLEACLRLERMSMAVRVQTGANSRALEEIRTLQTEAATAKRIELHGPAVEARLERIRAFCGKRKLPYDKRGLPTVLARDLGNPPGEEKRTFVALKKLYARDLAKLIGT